MEVGGREDMKTGRTTQITLIANSFEEERLLSAIYRMFESRKGKLSVSDGFDRLTWHSNRKPR